jgi:hypothetical protein
MDKYVTIVKHKKLLDMTKSQEVLCEQVKKLLPKKTTICLYGPTGCGKTFLTSHIFHKEKVIELTYDLIKVNFENAKSHILVDGVEVSEPIKSRGSFLIISDQKIDWCEHNIEVSIPQDEVYQISKKYFDFDFDFDAGTNIHSVLNDFELNLDTHRDSFLTPLDLVKDIVKNKKSAWDSIGHHFCEHGYSLGIIHENYTCPKSLEISEWLSLADIEDVRMYEHQHDSAGVLFSFFGIIVPAIMIPSDASMDKPGSVWTKYNNYKMRSKKFASMSNRISSTTVDIDSLMVMSLYCNKSIQHGTSVLKSYGLLSPDVDIMNHLVKLKQGKFDGMKTKTLQAVKSSLKSKDS